MYHKQEVQKKIAYNHYFYLIFHLAVFSFNQLLNPIWRKNVGNTFYKSCLFLFKNRYKLSK
jgi:hypothetical protein